MRRSIAAGRCHWAAVLSLGLLAVQPGLSQGVHRAPGSGEGAALGRLEVRVTGLRSARGLLHACVTRNPDHFPKCERDPAALRATVPAAEGARISFAQVPVGDYAVMVLHDENSNARIDTMLGIPREGVGFSRNPKLRFGPPRFEGVRLHLPVGPTETGVKLQYFL